MQGDAGHIDVTDEQGTCLCTRQSCSICLLRPMQVLHLWRPHTPGSCAGPVPASRVQPPEHILELPQLLRRHSACAPLQPQSSRIRQPHHHVWRRQQERRRPHERLADAVLWCWGACAAAMEQL